MIKPLTLREITKQVPPVPSWLQIAYEKKEEDIAWRISLNPRAVFGPKVINFNDPKVLGDLLKPGDAKTVYVAALYGENYNYDRPVIFDRDYIKIKIHRLKTKRDLLRYSEADRHELDLMNLDLEKIPVNHVVLISDDTRVRDFETVPSRFDEMHLGFGHEPWLYTWVKEERKRCPNGSRRDRATQKCKEV